MNTYKHNGWTFEGFIPINEKDIFSFEPIAGSYAVIKCQDKVLLCYNTWRKQWELPAGKREDSEHPETCAQRELYEETGQVADELVCLGLLKSQNFDKSETKYNPVYMQHMEELQPFIPNSETSKITLWDGKSNLGSIDSLDFRLIEALGILTS